MFYDENAEDMTYSVYSDGKCWVSGLTLEEARQWVADKDNPAMYEIAADDGIVND